MTNQDLLVQCFKNCRWMNSAGEIKDLRYANLFGELTNLMVGIDRPIEQDEVYKLMATSYMGDLYE